MGSTGDDVLIGTQSDIGDGTAAEFLTAIGETDAEGDETAALLAAIDVPEAGADEDEGDILDGGFGDDALLIGSEDTASGGEGNDVFNLGDWIEADRAATITDYTPDDDVIAFSYRSTETEPEVSVADDGEGNAVISADGNIVATVTGAAETLTADDILLIGDAPQDGLVLEGTEGDDTLTGSTRDDLINSDLGDDLILGLAGADIIRGSDGNDLIDAGHGDDRAFGGAGDDTMLGQQGDDFLRGSADNDLIIDTNGSDTLHGDIGDDTIISGNFINAAALSTSLQDGGTFDLASLDLSEDTDSEGDVIYGGLNDDMLYFGANDSVSGGRGAVLVLTLSDTVPFSAS